MTVETDIQTERAHRLRLIKTPDVVLDLNAEFDSRMHDQAHYEVAHQAWQFANSLDYHHPGLNKSVYLMHPLRVAEMYVSLSGKPVAEGVATALLHNILEVSGSHADDIAQHAGVNVAKAVALLTVNRDLQWDDDYKTTYYQSIYASELYVRQVKALDKLDNLYLLCLNPSGQIRHMYLREIKNWVMPMVEKDLPQISAYYNAVYENAVRVGFLKV